MGIGRNGHIHVCVHACVCPCVSVRVRACVCVYIVDSTKPTNFIPPRHLPGCEYEARQADWDVSVCHRLLGPGTDSLPQELPFDDGLAEPSASVLDAQAPELAAAEGKGDDVRPAGPYGNLAPLGNDSAAKGESVLRSLFNFLTLKSLRDYLTRGAGGLSGWFLECE